VATKDMTYAQQLRDYENAVLQKRLEELADDEIQALMEEIEVEDSKNVSKPASSATPPLSPETL
jgi:cytochrome c-type biogenesis protein CcmH/NrfG